jgi:RNA polymerase sigma factor (sigma-70 family)
MHYTEDDDVIPSDDTLDEHLLDQPFDQYKEVAVATRYPKSLPHPTQAALRMRMKAGDEQPAVEIKDYGMMTPGQALLLTNMTLVLALAKKMSPRISGDMVQAGALGLHEAIKRWEPERAKLTTYASQWIWLHIRDELTKSHCVSKRTTFKVPTTKWDWNKLPAWIRPMFVRGTDGKYKAVDKPWLKSVMAPATVSSLDAVTKDDEGDNPSPYDRLLPEDYVEPEYNFEPDGVTDLMLRDLSELPEVQRRIISLRLGLEQGRTMQWEGIANTVKLSSRHCKSLFKSAMETLREGMSRYSEKARDAKGKPFFARLPGERKAPNRVRKKPSPMPAPVDAAGHLLLFAL